MNVLSLFDGLSCGQIALKELGIIPAKYYASEIDKFAIAQTQLNFPNTIQLGSVLDVDVSKLEPIQLLLGGSPCQSFSFAGKRNGMSTTENEEIYTLDRYLQLKEEGFQFEGQSYLFWEYMRILRDSKPNYFLLENVEMGEKWETILSEAIGIRPVHINSALVSAQNRKRLYWVGQIRERLYYSENYCYLCGNEKYKKNENRRVQEESQRKGTAKVLGNSQKRYVNLQSMPKRVFKSKSERDNKNLFGGMSIDQQKNQRQKQESDNQKSIHEEVLSGKQTGASEISIGIQENKCRERHYAKGRFKTISSKEGEIQSIQGNESSKKQEDFRDNKYFESKTDMCCVQCGKGLDHRPRYSFVEGWKKYEGKSPSSLSKVQFDEIKQNNGRVYDIIPVGVQGLDSLFGETINPIPQPKDEGILLKDILEEDVDEKYYLSEKLIKFFERNTQKMKEKGNGFSFKPTDGNKKGNALTTKCGSRMDDDFILVIPEATSKGYAEINPGECFDFENPKSKTRRGRKMDVKCNSLMAQNMSFMNYTNDYRIRRLTPKECARLQTIPEWYEWKFVESNYFGYICSVTKKTIICKANVTPMAVSDRFQINQQDYATCTTLDLLELEKQRVEKLTKQKSVKLTAAIDMLKQNNTETYVSCITKDFIDMERGNFQSNNIKKNVSFVIKKLVAEELTECAPVIIEVSNYMEIHLLLKKGKTNLKYQLNQQDIMGVKIKNRDTKQLWSIKLGDLLKTEKLSTILTLVNWIIDRKIYIYAKDVLNIRLSIGNLNVSEQNYIGVELSDLRMESIISCSDAQQYKLLGNGWNIETVKHILKFMK